MKKAIRVSVVVFVLLIPHEIADKISREDGPVFNITPANLPGLMDKIMPPGFTTPGLR